MRLLLLGGGVALLLAWLELWRRRHEWRTGPNYVAHLKQWDAHSPQITPANIPAVQPLKVTRSKLRKRAEPIHGEFKRKA